jgi:hypothetical protein
MRPLHQLRWSPSPVNGGGTAFIKGTTLFLPCDSGGGGPPKAVEGAREGCAG